MCACAASSVLLLAALDLHGRCIERRLGQDLDAWAFVPSIRTDRTGIHPLHVVAKRAGVTLPEIELVAGECADSERRSTSTDRFTIATHRQAHGRHVLLIEDTWTSGGNAQSAEWVKAVETGRLQVPRLPMLLRIARVLDVHDLAELTGHGQ